MVVVITKPGPEDAKVYALAMGPQTEIMSIRNESYFVKGLALMGETCPGLTVKAFFPSMLTTCSAMMGATEFTYTTSARQDPDDSIHAVTRIA